MELPTDFLSLGRGSVTLQHGVPNDSNFGLILRRCHLLLYSEQSFKVVHVRRSANEATHAIVRRSRSV